MPRPPIRRRRPNSFTLKKQVNIPNPTQARQALEQKLSAKPVGKRPRDSDDSDDLVTPGSAARTRKRQEIFASGAVARGDQPGAYPTRTQRTRAMRENTVEILSQRSRSTSRANSVPSSKSPDPVSNQSSTLKRATAQPLEGSSIKRRKVSMPGTEQIDVNKAIAQTPQPEVSILGKIKPRKRQASILQLIENDQNNGSSILNSDDEELFLPDEISTPMTNNPNTAPTESMHGTSLRKRKLDSDLPRLSSVNRPSSSTKSAKPRELPLPSRSQRKKLLNVMVETQHKEDIMALPESSDDEDDSDKRHATSLRPRKQASQAVLAPSTQQLQSLMPSKKHISSAGRQPRGDFEISEDSLQNTDEDVDDEHDHSNFLPTRARRAPKPARTGGTKQVAKSTKAKSKPKVKSKSTKTISHTPSPMRLRAPLPLSSSKSGNMQAKSPSKQDTAMRNKPTNTSLELTIASTPPKGTRKRYGGSRQRATGKENQPISSSEALSNNSITGQQPRVATITAAPEVTAWNKKWADVDKFDLEFEEVSMSTRSSSPNAR